MSRKNIARCHLHIENPRSTISGRKNKGGIPVIQDIAPKKLDNQYHPERKISEKSTVLHFLGRKLLCRVTEDGTLVLPTYAEFSGIEADYTYLFAVDEQNYFLCRSDETLTIAPYEYQDINLFRTVQPRDVAYAAVTGFHLASWYADNRFCGRCGNPTEHHGALRMLKCPKCGNMIFPKIMPSVIVAVTRGDKLLLTRYNRPNAKLTALVAGFTEIGETVEDTVHREVLEEVGLKVKNLKYYKTQPWGISTGGLLVGFWCEAEGDDEPHVDGEELAEARFLTRDELKATYTDAGVALTGEMIQQFIEGNNP